MYLIHDERLHVHAVQFDDTHLVAVDEELIIRIATNSCQLGEPTLQAWSYRDEVIRRMRYR